MSHWPLSMRYIKPLMYLIASIELHTFKGKSQLRLLLRALGEQYFTANALIPYSTDNEYKWNIQVLLQVNVFSSPPGVGVGGVGFLR